jgi:hypothetical protein
MQQPIQQLLCVLHDGVFWHKDPASVIWKWDPAAESWGYWDPVEGGPVPPPTMWGLPIDLDNKGVRWRKNADGTIWRWDQYMNQWVFWQRGGPGPEPPEVILRTVLPLDPQGRMVGYTPPTAFNRQSPPPG